MRRAAAFARDVYVVALIGAWVFVRLLLVVEMRIQDAWRGAVHAMRSRRHRAHLR